MGKEIHLKTAMKIRDDEFYTRYSDIETELSHYFMYLCGKTIYCNCDDPRLSNFSRYFIRNFHKIGLKRLICTGYNKLSTGSYLDVCKEDIPINSGTLSDAELNEIIYEKTGNLVGNGDFASYECISYLKESDIIVTNPPFSKYRDFFELLIKYGKDMILLIPLFALSYKVIFPYISTGDIKVSNFSNFKSITFVRPPPNKP